MNCQKCGKHASVHLTELITDKGGQKQAMEIHLCLAHAEDLGIISPAVAAEGPVSLHEVFQPSKPLKSLAIVSKEEQPTDLAVTRPPASLEQPTCEVCGMTWQAFKQHGVLGCPACYERFEPKLTPLIKRAQESFTQHAGKMPTGVVDPTRQVATARLRRELDQALTQENYEAAARLRDQLKTLGQN